jgi:bile acid:Na+ symporter, BASS family
MNSPPKVSEAVSHFLHRYFLWLLIGVCGAAALWPAPGLWIKDLSFGEVPLFGQETKFTLPMLLLALLLADAGLLAQVSRLRDLRHFSLILFVGLAANLVVPITFTFGVTPVIGLWLDPDEVQDILVGLALIAAMPVAGSSTAWSQNANGNLVLSLGLVVCSTLLSPLTTPVTLRSVGLLTSGDHAEDLNGLAAHGTGPFLTVCVVLPSLLGLSLNRVLGEARIAPAKSYLKVLGAVTLLLLIYANASVSLPEAVAYPDADFLATAVGVAVSLGATAFASGWAVGRLLKADGDQQTSLTFGLGMSNNGTGLVLASVALADHPRVMLPLIIYNLVQHLLAGGVAFLRGRATGHQDTWPHRAETGPAPYLGHARAIDP